MAELRLRQRHRLKAKEARSLSDLIEKTLGVRPFDSGDVDMAEADGWKAVLVKNTIMALVKDDTGFLTLKGILTYKPEKGYLEVDEGAVKFLANGADVMAPGVVGICPSLKEGQWVFVRDAKHKKPLCVGILLMQPEKIMTERRGKCVKTFHYVGDEIWKYGEI